MHPGTVSCPKVEGSRSKESSVKGNLSSSRQVISGRSRNIVLPNSQRTYLTFVEPGTHHSNRPASRASQVFPKVVAAAAHHRRSPAIDRSRSNVASANAGGAKNVRKTETKKLRRDKLNRENSSRSAVGRRSLRALSLLTSN